MASFAGWTYHFRLLQTLQHARQSYAPRKQRKIETQCSLSVFHIPPTFPPFVITSNLWTFISTPVTQESAIAMIYPDNATSSSPLQQPLHILKLPMACSVRSRHFHLPPHYKDNTMTIYVSLERENLNSFNASATDFDVWQHIGGN